MQSASPLLRLSVCLLVLSAAASAASLRRPHTGFLGMRGKRSTPPLGLRLSAGLLQHLPGQLPSPQQLRQLFRAAELYRGTYVNSLEDKRAPSGFAGMRGRKRKEETQGQQDDMDKRVPSGFSGLRGKKEDMLEDVGEKRTPRDAFFGLGGGREEQS